MADAADDQIPQNVDSKKMRVFLTGLETNQDSAEKMLEELNRLIRTNINKDNILDGINNQLNDWNEDVRQSVIKEIAKSIEEFGNTKPPKANIYDEARVRSVMLREMERVRIDGLSLESIPGIGPKAAETLRHTFEIDTFRAFIDEYNTAPDDFETFMITVHRGRRHFAAKTTQAMVRYMAKVLDGYCDIFEEMALLAVKMYDAGEITKKDIEKMGGELGNMVRAKYNMALEKN